MLGDMSNVTSYVEHVTQHTGYKLCLRMIFLPLGYIRSVAQHTGQHLYIVPWWYWYTL